MGGVTTYLESQKGKLLEIWLHKFWEVFGESAYYLKKEVDEFTNPFGYQIRECFEGILKALSRDLNWQEIEPVLDKLAQLRAVQEGLPSRACMAFLLLKGILREQLGEELVEKFGLQALLEVEDKINAMMLRYFDFYQAYRERLYEIRVNEFKRNNYLLLKRAGLILEEGPSQEENQNLKKH